MASLKDLVGDQKPVVAYPKTIRFGPIELEGYMLENGQFRQSISSTERALGAQNQRLIPRLLVPQRGGEPVLTLPANPLQLQGSDGKTSKNFPSDNPILVPVRCPGVMHHTQVAYTINLPMVIEIWKHIAQTGGKFSKQALELLGLAAVHSLERCYQEAFGIEDSRSTDERLIDWAIRLDAGRHFPLFGNQFNKHFARVTGRCVGYDAYAAVCLADLVYHRLPEPVYEKLKEVNKVNPETGRREHTYAQLMTDDMLAQMREVVAAVTNQLANTSSKEDDPRDYRRLLRRLDKTMPRYKTRASNQRRIYPESLRRSNEKRRILKEQQNDDSKA
ncbi:hypothetical protein MedDCM-OCT-S14-C1-cds38 [uncultured Mediterranean phage MEDS2 group]|nr:hypothetical protein MedDCM-OCT-S14-C1-cds38 [uncultured Mediterranean phage MEDS2 group]